MGADMERQERLGGGVVVLRRRQTHTVGTILPDPAGEALAGAVDGVAGAVVGAAADLGAGSAEAAAGTHCGEKERKRKKKSQRQANN